MLWVWVSRPLNVRLRRLERRMDILLPSNNNNMASSKHGCNSSPSNSRLDLEVLLYYPTAVNSPAISLSIRLRIRLRKIPWNDGKVGRYSIGVVLGV